MSVIVLLQELRKSPDARVGTELFKLVAAAQKDYDATQAMLRDLRRSDRNHGRSLMDLQNQIGIIGKKLDNAARNCSAKLIAKDQKIDNLQLSYSRSRDGLKQVKAMHKNVDGACPICGVNRCDTFVLADGILGGDPENPGNGGLGAQAARVKL